MSSLRQRAFWAFQPVVKPAVPAGTESSPIDRFINRQLEARKLAANPPAPRHDLIRRAYLDLTGLPPTYEDIQAFVNDKSPDAFAKVVNRLLASPHYGERWARYWLDIAAMRMTARSRSRRSLPHVFPLSRLGNPRVQP